MKLVLTSDTEGEHWNAVLPKGDVLIHAGDIIKLGFSDSQVNQLRDFIDWFSSQPHKYKIFIGGNHDSILLAPGFTRIKHDPPTAATYLPENMFYLNNEMVEIEGYKFWGSPNTVAFFRMAFEEREDKLKEIYSEIPDDVDVLITHTPPLGVMDENSKGKNCGSVSLRERLTEITPKVHVFGHVHHSYGHQYIGGTDCFNASYMWNSNNPFTIEI